MSDKNNAAGVTQAQEQTKPPAAVAQKQAEPKFPLQRLRENCVALFGVTSSTFDGAAYRLKDAEYTVAEMKLHIEKWQGSAAIQKKKEGK